MYISLNVPEFACARRYSTVTSTMDVARELLLHESPNSAEWCAALIADEQTAGRGRQGRSWLTSAGAFMATFVLGTTSPRTALAGYSLVVGVAVSEVLESFGVQSRLKWPNDIVIVGDNSSVKKLGGILIEVQEVESNRFVLVGLGLNMSPAPEELSNRAVSLHELGHMELVASELCGPVGSALKKWHNRFIDRGGFNGVRDEWISRSCFSAGRTELTIDVGNDQQLRGVFSGVDDSGALLITIADQTQPVLSGHIASFVL